jgi:hypothetical protein
MTSFNVISVTQTDKYPIQWIGLKNITIADTFGEGSLLTGNYARSLSYNVGNLYVTERLRFVTNTTIDPTEAIEKITFSYRLRGNFINIEDNNVSIEMKFYIKDLEDTGTGTLIFSDVVSKKFTNRYREINLSNRRFNFRNAAVIEVEFWSIYYFFIDLDKLVILGNKKEADQTVQLSSQTINVFQGNYSFNIDVFAELSSQTLNLEQGFLTSIFDSNFVTLLNLDVNLQLGNISTIAPHTWSVFGDYLVKFQNIIFDISSSAISVEISQQWENTDSTQLSNYDTILIDIPSSATLKDTSSNWVNWEESSVIVSGTRIEQTSDLSPDNIIYFEISNSFNFDDGITTNEPWMTTMSIDMTTIFIQISTVAFWDDAYLSVWSTFGSGAVVPSEIYFNITNTAFLPQQHSSNSIYFEDLNLEMNLNFINSPWELWDNQPTYKQISFAKNDAIYSTTNNFWMNFGVNDFEFTNLTINTLTNADFNPLFVSLNSMNFENMNLYDPLYDILSSVNLWLSWDNQPLFKFFNIDSLEQSLYDSSAISTNIINFENINFFDPLLSSSNLWMNWDNQPLFKFLNIDSLEQSLYDSSAISTNIINFENINFFDPLLSSSNLWMNWDNQPLYNNLYYNINNIALFDITFSSQNSIDFTQLDFDHGLPSASSLWFNWDNYPNFIYLNVTSYEQASYDSSAISTNIINFENVDLLNVSLSTSNVWMAWDNQPNYVIMLFDCNILDFSFNDNRMPASGLSSDWMDTFISSASITTITIQTSSVAIGYDSYIHPNVVDYIYDIDLLDIGISGQSSWAKWDNYPQWRNIEIYASSIAVLTISSPPSPWLGWNGSLDSSIFLLSDGTVFENVINFDFIDDTNYLAAIYSTTSSIRTMTVLVSGFDIQLSPDLKIIASDKSKAAYIFKMTTSSVYIASYLKESGGLFTPSYTFVNTSSHGQIEEGNTGIDIAFFGTSAFVTGFEIGNNIITEYRKIDNNVSLVKLEALIPLSSLSVIASANISFTGKVISQAKINSSAYAVNLNTDNENTHVIFASSLVTATRNLANLRPGAVAAVSSNGYIQFYKDGSAFKFSRFDLDNFNSPIHRNTVTINNTIPFVTFTHMEAVELSLKVYAVFVNSDNKIYVNIISLNDDNLTLDTQTGWKTFVSGNVAAGTFRARKIRNENKIAVVFETASNSLVIKVMSI